MTKMNAVGWFDIYVDNFNRAVTFYEKVLGVSLEDMPDPTGENQMKAFPTEMSAYGAGGAITKSAHASPGIGGTVIYFMAEDCAEPQARVAEAGGVVIRPKFSIGEFGFITLCQDTEGNMFGISSMK